MVLTSKSVGTGPSSYEKRIYWAAVSQRLRNAALYNSCKSNKKVPMASSFSTLMPLCYLMVTFQDICFTPFSN